MRQIFLLIILTLISCKPEPKEVVLSTYENGKINQVAIYENPEDTTTYLFKHFYSSGQLSIYGKVVNNQKKGVWKNYYEDGTLLVKTTYKDNLKHGPIEQYDSLGNLTGKGEMINDKKSGQWYVSYGDHYANAEFKNDKKVGQWIYFYNSGDTALIENFNNRGVYHGKVIEYWLNGKIKDQGEYVEGAKHGQWKHFFNNGQLEAIEVWEHGQPVDTWIQYDSLGNEIDRGIPKIK